MVNHIENYIKIIKDNYLRLNWRKIVLTSYEYVFVHYYKYFNDCACLVLSVIDP